MHALPRASLLLLSIVLQGPASGWAQAVPARLALYTDPTPATAAGQLVLGSTTLDEARRLFPDAPAHNGPLPYRGNPQYLSHEPDVEIAGAVIKVRHSFWLGQGRAVLIFDQHQRLVWIEQGRYGYADPGTGKPMVQVEPWEATPVSRNDFRHHYPQTKGEWFDPAHYHIQGKISDCVAVTGWFSQSNGYDKLGTLSYRYICPTQPIAGR